MISIAAINERQATDRCNVEAKRRMATSWKMTQFSQRRHRGIGPWQINCTEYGLQRNAWFNCCNIVRIWHLTSQSQAAEGDAAKTNDSQSGKRQGWQTFQKRTWEEKRGSTAAIKIYCSLIILWLILTRRLRQASQDTSSFISWSTFQTGQDER